MNVLITGGCGFVGRHLVRRCLDLNYDITVVDDLSTGIMPPLNQKTRGLYEFMDVRSWFRDNACTFDLVFHCAAVVGGRLKIEGDPIGVATDLAIDADFFNWLVAEKTKAKIVYFSSSAAYPIELQQRGLRCSLSENLINLASTRIGMPDMTYGWAKLTGEYLAQFAVENYGLDIVVYRPFSGYGADQDATYPFPAIMERVRRREYPLIVWGSGEQVRDFIHIDDVVDAVFATFEKLPSGDVLNLGTGVPTSFHDLAEAAAAVAGYEPSIDTDTDKPEGAFYRVADPYKLLQFYAPKISLEQGIGMALTGAKD